MSDTDEDRGVTRREALAAVAGAGGFGLAGGVGTGAVLSDRESFDGLFESGTLELEVSWEDDRIQGGNIPPGGGQNVRAEIGEEDTSGSGLLTISLPGSENNPAHVWFRPTCPSDPALADALELEIYRSNEDGDTEPLVVSGTLRELAEQEGTKLRFDGTDCVAPAGTEYLLVEWEYTEGTAEFDESGFDLEFSAKQCRNNDSPQNPYDGQSCDQGSSDGKDISWVAFCPKGGATLNDGDSQFSVDGAELTLHDAPESLATVILKYGTEIRVFDTPGTSGTFTTTSGGVTYDQEAKQFPSSGRSNPHPCLDTEGDGVKHDIGADEEKEADEEANDED